MRGRFSSRAWDAFEIPGLDGVGIASVTGLAIQPDLRLRLRLRERLNWDGGITHDAFLALWARTTHDRDLVPEGG